MKKVVILLVLCSLCSQGAEAQNDTNPVSSVRDALVRSGFIAHRAERKESIVNSDFTYFLHALLGNARLETKQVIFNADRILFVYYLNGKKLHMTHPFEIYAEGNVVITPGREYDKGPKVFLMSDALYYDGRTLQGLAVNTRVRVTGLNSLDKPEVPRKLGLLTKELRFKGKIKRLKEAADDAKVIFHFFKGKEISVSPCDFSSQHWGLKCDTITATREKNKNSYLLQTEGQGLALMDHKVLPLPPISVSSNLFRSIPLRRAEVLSSRKFGYGMRTTWDAAKLFGLEPLAKKLERKTGVPVETDLEFDAMSKRGIGIGSGLRYGTRPVNWKQEQSWRNIAGNLRVYGIHDTGEDRHEDELYGGHDGDDWRKDDRYRLRYFNRMRLPVVGEINTEVAMWRDRHFYKEFFEREFYGERTPETFVQWRRKFGESTVASAFFRPRVNPFENYTETLPEAKLQFFPRSVSDTFPRITVKGRAQVGNFRFQSDDLYRSAGYRTERYHTSGGIALPMGLGRYIRFRPFYELSGTKYRQRYDSHYAPDRLVQTGGVAAATHLWNNYRLTTSWFDLGTIKHVIVPEISYHNSFFSSEDHENLYPYDDIDLLDQLEYMELTLATYLLARKVQDKGVTDQQNAPTIRRLLELRTRVRYYPRASRDNRHGGLAAEDPENFSNVYVDLFSDIIHPKITLGIEGQIDTNRGKGFAVLDPYIRFTPVPEFAASVGELFITGDRALSREESNYFWADLRWKISRLYSIRANCRYDFAQEEFGEHSISIARSFHCFTVIGGLEYDNGDNELKYTIHVYPSGFVPSDSSF